MKASSLEFRFRYLLHAVLFALGFWAPWNEWLHLDPPGPNAHVWGLLATSLSQTGWISIGPAFDILLVLAICSALAAAALRTWGSAYLGASIVQDAAMHTAPSTIPGILTDGPFRYLRNPLYLGTFLHTVAVALLMPRSGAVFTLLLVGVLQIRLILAEEAFLSLRLGPAYLAYCSLVPRIIPTLRPHTTRTHILPRWPQAFLGEIYMWGVAASFTFAGWRYNASLLIQCVIVSFGVALTCRALLPKPAPANIPAPSPPTPSTSASS